MERITPPQSKDVWHECYTSVTRVLHECYTSVTRVVRTRSVKKPWHKHFRRFVSLRSGYGRKLPSHTRRDRLVYATCRVFHQTNSIIKIPLFHRMFNTECRSTPQNDDNVGLSTSPFQPQQKHATPNHLKMYATFVIIRR